MEKYFKGIIGKMAVIAILAFFLGVGVDSGTASAADRPYNHWDANGQQFRDSRFDGNYDQMDSNQRWEGRDNNYNGYYNSDHNGQQWNTQDRDHGFNHRKHNNHGWNTRKHHYSKRNFGRNHNRR